MGWASDLVEELDEFFGGGESTEKDDDDDTWDPSHHNFPPGNEGSIHHDKRED